MFKKIFIISICLYLASCGFAYHTPRKEMKIANNYYNSQENIDWVVIKLKKWKKECNPHKKDQCYWGRDEKLLHLNSGIVNSTGIAVKEHSRSKYYKKSYETIQEFGDDKLLYVGKWRYVDKMGKNIRLIATKNNTKDSSISVYFETKDENNKNISYRPLQLSKKYNKENGYLGQGEAIGEILWFDTYGYNAYLDLKTKEIKQAKE
ncbi:hypothetical protein ACFL0U_01275 [Pseudomonadota bacterium]